MDQRSLQEVELAQPHPCQEEDRRKALRADARERRDWESRLCKDERHDQEPC